MPIVIRHELVSAPVLECVRQRAFSGFFQGQVLLLWGVRSEEGKNFDHSEQKACSEAQLEQRSEIGEGQNREVSHGVGADGVGVKFPIFAVNCCSLPLSFRRSREKRRKRGKMRRKRGRMCKKRGKTTREAFLLTVGASLLTVKLLYLQSLKALIRRTFPL